MNLFDNLVDTALSNQIELSSLRHVVEKELLHHDILRIMSQSGLIKDLTFIGGTALRLCYGGVRLSEDLDFTGGEDFSRSTLSSLGQILVGNLQEKYGLKVEVSEPVKDISNVDTWKIKIITRPNQRDLPMQRINIDICAVNSYEKKPMLLNNPYQVDMGTSGLIIRVQSQEEIFVDKLLAFALRPNRLKHRDLWDMFWLHQQGVEPHFDLIPQKLNERNIEPSFFLELYKERERSLSAEKIFRDFSKEMQRFLPPKEIETIISQEFYWELLVNIISGSGARIRQQVF